MVQEETKEISLDEQSGLTVLAGEYARASTAVKQWGVVAEGLKDKIVAAMASHVEQHGAATYHVGDVVDYTYIAAHKGAKKTDTTKLMAFVTPEQLQSCQEDTEVKASSRIKYKGE